MVDAHQGGLLRGECTMLGCRINIVQKSVVDFILIAVTPPKPILLTAHLHFIAS